MSLLFPKASLVLTLLIGCAGPGTNAATQPPSETRPTAELVESEAPTPPLDDSHGEDPLASVTVAPDCPSAAPSPAKDARAKQDFALVEKFFQEEFMAYRIATTPKTKKEADRVLGKLIQLADSAQKRYLELAEAGGPWALAARVRVGDVRFFQAHKIATIPTPIGIVSIAARTPNRNMLLMYEEAIKGLTNPLEEQAQRQWVMAIEQGKELCISNAWTILATVRLAHLENRDAPVTTSTVKPTCSAQTPTSTLLAVPQAELDKADAYYQKTFAGYRVELVPRTAIEAYRFMDEINLLASHARVKFLDLAKGKQGPLAIAAQVLAGDVTYHQAQTLLDIPAPKDIFDLEVPLPENKLLIDYHAGLDQVGEALEDLARKHWNAAAQAGIALCINNKWTKLASDRLARPRLPSSAGP